VREIAEAAAKIERALNDAEAGLSLARWASSPDGRWAVHARTMELGRPPTKRDRALAAVAALPEALAALPLPGEEPEQPNLGVWGWGGIGQPQPPGSMRVS
jgi:hypothetical protein